MEVHFVGNPPLHVGNSGVIFHPLPISTRSGRLKRILVRGLQAYRLALAVDADVYHFHDPELLPWGMLLKLRGRLVIYDAHEDVPRDILTKAWIPRLFRQLVANVAERVENFIARRLDVVITATPFICDRFAANGVTSVAINNFPKLGELECTREIEGALSSGKLKNVCYTGAITEERGAIQMVSALSKVNVNLLLAGKFSPNLLRETLSQLEGWSRVCDLGLVTRDQLPKIFATSFAGLVLFHPVPNNINAQPNKLFEYMSSGLPVVASDLPSTRDVLGEAGVYFTPGRMDSMLAEVVRLLADQDAYAAACRASRQQAARLGWEARARTILAFALAQLD